MIIAFSGHRGVGKTLAAEYLVDKYNFTKVSFADKLKEFSEMLFPGISRDITVLNKETPYFENGESRRDFWIKFGQFMRYFDSMYWVKASLPKDLKHNNLTVIDDLRFQNEAEFLKTKGAILIRIERYKSHNPYKTELHDISETDLDNYKDFDFTINDVENRSPQALHIRLDEIMGLL